jgi:hypothetical protein
MITKCKISSNFQIIKSKQKTVVVVDCIAFLERRPQKLQNTSDKILSRLYNDLERKSRMLPSACVQG